MRISRNVKKILKNYNSDSPGVKANLTRILMNGKLKFQIFISIMIFNESSHFIKKNAIFWWNASGFFFDFYQNS